MIVLTVAARALLNSYSTVNYAIKLTATVKLTWLTEYVKIYSC